jgi:uncharacterized protein YggE
MWISQSIPHPWGVSVFGSALVQTNPDGALLKVAATDVDMKPAQAFKRVQEQANRIRACLRTHGVADASVQTARVSLKPELEYVASNRKFLGYRAQINFRVATTNLDDVESLVAELVESGSALIESLEFHSSQLQALRAMARQNAIQSARKKAEVYAQAAGVRLGAVLHIEDVNPDELSRGGHGGNVDLTAHDETSTDALRSGSITIAAAVMIGFSIQAQT